MSRFFLLKTVLILALHPPLDPMAERDDRPEYGFVILSNGEILRGRNPYSYTEDQIARWYGKWIVMKMQGCFDSPKAQPLRVANEDADTQQTDTQQTDTQQTDTQQTAESKKTEKTKEKKQK